MLPPSRCALSARRLPVEQRATTSGEWLPTEVAPRAAQAVCCAVPLAAMAPRRCSASGSMPSGHARWPRRALTIPRSLCIIPLPTVGYRPQRSDIGVALEVEAALGGKAARSCTAALKVGKTGYPGLSQTRVHLSVMFLLGSCGWIFGYKPWGPFVLALHPCERKPSPFLNTYEWTVISLQRGCEQGPQRLRLIRRRRRRRTIRWPFHWV